MSRKNERRYGGGDSKKKNEVFRKSVRERKNIPDVTGIAQMTREGFVFVKVEGQEDDIYVRANKTRGALNGDMVRVKIKSPKTTTRRMEGEVVEIVERSQKPFIGVLHVVGNQAWVLMQSKNMPYDISVDVVDKQGNRNALYEQKGMKVAVIVDDWRRGEPNPHGHVIDVLGPMGENDTEMHAILAEYGLPYRFEPEVENAADSISEEITAKDLKGRTDFRDRLTFTIDPADAKDFDDALSFRALENGNFEVGVHIADVSYYVTPDSVVDKEARARGTSVYLVDRTIPMLPEKLCNKLCSLRPNEDKLAFSAMFEITPRGKVFNQWFGRTVMRSDYRFAYSTAQEIIDRADEIMNVEMHDDSDQKVLVPVETKEAVLQLWHLASILRKKRFAEGAISFERPEMKVVVDEKGKPTDVRQVFTREANWLIEEFMLLANRSVAEFIATEGHMDGKERKKAKTFIYRVHDEPNAEKLMKVKDFAGFFGYKTELGEEGNGRKIAKELNALLDSAKDKPEFQAIEILALRSMSKACYSTDNIGHYGLAFRFYTHFTSPIRRYPDTMVHRLLAMYLDGASSQNKDYYSAQCQYASEREVIAANAERDSVKYKLVEFMQDKVGGEYDGHISGLTEWGMYVEVEPTKIEGMVPLRDIKSDFFEFDEQHYKIVGRRTGVVYRLGDPVRIRVKSTNLDQRLLDYELIETELESRVEERRSWKEASGTRPSGKENRKSSRSKREEERRKGQSRSKKNFSNPEPVVQESVADPKEKVQLADYSGADGETYGSRKSAIKAVIKAAKEAKKKLEKSFRKSEKTPSKAKKTDKPKKSDKAKKTDKVKKSDKPRKSVQTKKTESSDK